MKGILVAVAVASGLVTSGCVSVKSYVDPQYQKATYDTVQRRTQLIAAKVDVHFQRNGEAFAQADGELRGHVERTLRASGVFAPSATVSSPLISVTANNIADLAAARAKGFGTGLTFGAAGSMVDDNYEFSCAYADGGKTQELKYLHAIHSGVGSHQAPAGLTATTPADAFGRVVEDVVLNFVKDLQDQGILPKR